MTGRRGHADRARLAALWEQQKASRIARVCNMVHFRALTSISISPVDLGR